MKTLLFPTDFSATAGHAIEYGYLLAAKIEANVVLCNAFIVPAEIPQAGIIAWPMPDYEETLKDNDDELKKIKHDLEESNATGRFKPMIDIVSEIGTVVDVVRNATATRNADLVVIGTHHGGGFGSMLIGDHCQGLIETLGKPLLLVPPATILKTPVKIAFASDFKHPEEDLRLIYSLIPMAKKLGAEIHLTHVYHEQNHNDNFRTWISQFLAELSREADHPFVFAKVLKNDHAVDAFEQLCKDGDIDMLVMVHRHHGFFESIFRGSHTSKMAARINIPLLVFNSER